jgi:hypothetical protein
VPISVTVDGMFIVAKAVAKNALIPILVIPVCKVIAVNAVLSKAPSSISVINAGSLSVPADVFTLFSESQRLKQYIPIDVTLFGNVIADMLSQVSKAHPPIVFNDELLVKVTDVNPLSMPNA